MLFAYPRIPDKLQQRIRWFYQHYSIPRWMVFAVDVLSVFLIFFLAYLLRFNFVISDFSPDLAFLHALVTVFVYMVFSPLFQSYSGLIRHTTLSDIFTVFKTTSFSF